MDYVAAFRLLLCFFLFSVFLRGGFGIFLDCLGIIFGIIAIIIGKKRNVPCGMAVAGIIVGVLGAGIMLFLMYFPQVYQHFNPPDPMELP